MKRILALMAAFAVIAVVGDTTASAQSLQSGYEFGTGLKSAGFGVYPPYGYAGPQLATSGRYGSGYGFGSGFYRGRGFIGAGIFTRQRLEEPPYFAKFPPVYYSHVVKRPYGVSPFAAPSGIVPVEMSVPAPLSLKNPYFQSEVAPVSNEAPLPAKKTDDTTDKATRITNPNVNQAFAFGG